MNMKDDRGETATVVSALGAALTGSPVVVALISNTDLAGNASFVVAFLVSLIALGTGVGRIYSVWKKSILEQARRDDTLLELCERLENIEKRQIEIQAEVVRQAAIIAEKTT